MQTLAPTTCRHVTLDISTDRPTVFVDITERVERLIAESGIRAGIVNIQTRHTTTAIVVNEHEPMLLADFARLLEATAPRHVPYRHDDPIDRGLVSGLDDHANGHAHCRALLLCPSATVNVSDGRLQLGCWQRIFLAELDGPRLREVSVLIFGEGAR